MLTSDLWGRRLRWNSSPLNHSFHLYAETRRFGAKYRWRNATMFPPFAPCFECSRHRGSEENASSEGSSSCRDCEFCSFSTQKFRCSPFASFPLPGVPPLCVRSVAFRLVSLFVSAQSLWPTASVPASQTDGRSVREGVYLCTNRGVKKTPKQNSYLTLSDSLLLQIYWDVYYKSFYLYRMTRIEDDAVTLRRRAESRSGERGGSGDVGVAWGESDAWEKEVFASSYKPHLIWALCMVLYPFYFLLLFLPHFFFQS